jgi:hypothetical protein
MMHDGSRRAAGADAVGGGAGGHFVAVLGGAGAGDRPPPQGQPRLWHRAVHPGRHTTYIQRKKKKYFIAFIQIYCVR